VSEQVRVAVVGCGGIARQVYLPLLDASEKARITAIVDASPDVLEAMSDRYPRATRHASAEGLDSDAHDCALVLTPIKEGIDAHYEPVRTIAAENGTGGPAFAKASPFAKATGGKSADRLGSPPYWSW